MCRGYPLPETRGSGSTGSGRVFPSFPDTFISALSSDEVRIDNGTFRIPSRLKPHTHFPVDELLVAFSQDAPDRVVAVILSGEGTDGARGVRAVRKAGGTVFAQDPATAEHPDMPLAAIDTGQTDGVPCAGPYGAGDTQALSVRYGRSFSGTVRDDGPVRQSLPRW